MKNSYLRFTWVLALILVASLGCSQEQGDETAGVINAVKRYNSLLRRTYLEANIRLLESVATQRQMDKVFPVVQALRSQNSSMISEQSAFAVRTVRMDSKHAAAIQTDESWKYWWQDKDSGVVTKKQETVTYRIEYGLVREGRDWKVDSIRALP